MNSEPAKEPWPSIPLPPAVRTAYTAMLRLCDIIVALALATEVGLVTINVFSRYFFHHTFGWMNEFAQYTLLWVFVPGSVVLLDRYGLFYAEVLLLFIKNAVVRKLIFAVNCVAMIAFFATVFWTGIDYVKITSNFELDYSSVPKWWFYSSMPVWGLLMLIVVVKKLLGIEDPELTESEGERADTAALGREVRP
jgi:TRAP-type C4-dicarboxylate transport system permease small subunit